MAMLSSHPELRMFSMPVDALEMRRQAQKSTLTVIARCPAGLYFGQWKFFEKLLGPTISRSPGYLEQTPGFTIRFGSKWLRSRGAWL
jgi:hypothetical protein